MVFIHLQYTIQYTVHLYGPTMQIKVTIISMNFSQIFYSHTK